MAGNNLARRTSVQRNIDELDRHLEKTYGMPTPEWWKGATRAYAQFAKIVNPSSGAAPESELEEPVDQYAANARLVRAASLPEIIVLAAGNYALSLTSVDEALQCVAFGTIGPKRYVELFWESIAEAQALGAVKISVYEVLQGPAPQITLGVEQYTFEFKYLQCQTLVRSYPGICDAPTSFLEDRSSCSDAVQREVESLQRVRRLQAKFQENPDCRRAHYWKRAWAIGWGRFDSDKEAQRIFEVCNDASLESSQDLSSIISKFVAEWARHYPEALEYQAPVKTSNFRELLTSLEIQPIHVKLNYPSYLQVTLLYSGSSRLTGGKWISMVERRLEWLKSSRYTEPLATIVHVANIPGLDNMISSPGRNSGTASHCRVWPQRLVRGNVDPESGVYEGSFILGLDIETCDGSVPMQIAERWRRGIEDDELTLKDQCFINVIILHEKEAIGRQGLKLCSRTWPRQILKAEDNPKESHSLKPSKREKRESSKESKDSKVEDTSVKEPRVAKKLRPASDVLGRLRYGGDYDIDEFVVGYKDRHSSRLMEKAVAQWAKDTTDEEFIPEHRIEYFKRYSAGGKEEVLWDKSSRLDKIFQHGGSG